MSAADREKIISESEAALKKIEEDFKAFVEGLNKKYSEESEKKDKAIDAIKSESLGLLKSVHAYAKKGKAEL